MKQKTKLFVLILSFCFVVTTALLGVFSAEKFNFNMEGTIDFFGSDAIQTSIDFSTPDVSKATISQATLSGLTQKTSGNMQSFTVTNGSAVSEIQTWKNFGLAFDEAATTPGQATIEFTVSNTSQTSTENLMVKLSSNSTPSSPIQVTPSADYCIAPNSSHTFTVNVVTSDIEQAMSFGDIKLDVEIKGLNANDVPTVTEQKANGFIFTTNSTTMTATFYKYTGTESSIVIPSVVKDANGNLYTVTDIPNVYDPDDYILSAPTSVTFPSTLTTIGKYAFQYTNMLTGTLTIPSSVTSIGYSAFSGCSNLTGDLIIPNSITTINSGTFSGCTGFDSLTIGANVSTIDSTAFSSCDFETIDVVSGNETYYSKNNCVITRQDKVITFGCKNSVIPQDEGMLKIGASAFSGYTGLTGDLLIPNCVTEIGASAFSGCTGLTGNLTIGDSVTTIGESAFKGCSGLTGTLTLGSRVTTINKYAFSGCRNFATVVVDSENATYYSSANCVITKQNKQLALGFNSSVIPQNEGILTIGDYSFESCSGSMANFVIPSTVTSIGNYAFEKCTEVSGDLVIPNSVTTIGKYAFYNCKKLTSLTLGSTVKTIGEDAFYGCSGFTGTLTIPSTVTTINNHAFLGCSGFTGTLTIPNSVTKIDYSAFQNCSGFTGLTIGTGMATIYRYSFDGCTGLSGSLTIPDNVTTIENGVFDGCTGLTGTLTIGKNVATIAAGAFNGCKNFSAVTVSSSNTTYYSTNNCIISRSAKVLVAGFNCSTIPQSAGILEIGKYAFNDCTGLTGTLTIPNTVTKITSSAFQSCTGITGITIGSGVTEIDGWAFSYCSKLTTITIKATTPPTLGSNCFLYTALSSISVPSASLSSYKSASGWSSYSSKMVGI